VAERDRKTKTWREESYVDGIDHLCKQTNKKIDNGVRSGRINAATPFEQGLTDSGCSTLTSMNANQPE